MRLAIQNMETFSASFPTNFRCCCLPNRKSGCLKQWMDVWRGKELVKSSQIYFSNAKIWRRFRGLMKCCPWIVINWCPRVKPVKKLFRMKVVKERRRAKRQSKYRNITMFFILCYANNSVFLSFPCEEISAEGESCSSTEMCAIISTCENYFTKSRCKVITIFLVSTTWVLGVGTHVMAWVVTVTFKLQYSTINLYRVTLTYQWKLAASKMKWN